MCATVVCGNPGTGKSTIVESVLHQKVDRERRRVVVMAPTGMAVNNLVANKAQRRVVHYAMKLSLGFGGHLVAATVRRHAGFN